MEFSVKSSKREEIIDITKQVQEAVAKSRVKDGICLVYTGHATCAIIINENYDSAVCEDILSALRKLAPAGVWKHDKIDDNADAHIKAAIISPSQIVPIENGKLQLGRWQSVALADFDGPRERSVIVKVL